MSTASQTIPVTVIGFGSSARTFHLPFVTSLPEGFHLHSIQQRPGSKSGPDASQVYPRTIIHPSIQSVFGLDAAADEANALPKGGLVVITIANSLHFSTAKLALENGRHVLCEKPLALQSEQVLELERVAKENGVLVSAFQSKFNQTFETLVADKCSKTDDGTLTLSRCARCWSPNRLTTLARRSFLNHTLTDIAHWPKADGERK